MPGGEEMTSAGRINTAVVLPDPGQAGSLDELIERLRSLKVWAGNPSHDAIKNRVNVAWKAAGRPADELAKKTTVVDCFRLGRRRVNTDLLLAVVRALHPDEGYVAQWRQALRVIGGEVQAAAQVRAQDRLPDDLAEFTGRTAELDALQRALQNHGAAGNPVVISAIEGMAGVGKTQLAVHAGHLLSRERPFQQVLFVNLRGFGPDPTQPPADPSAVLDSFLRLLGVPGQQIPHELTARTASYRQRLAGKPALVVLDNAADENQVLPLLPDSPECLTLVTSRRSLTGLQPATHLAVDVFTPDEALDFLKQAVADVPVGDEPNALVRIARHCGHLPLALGLVAGQMRTRPTWTVTDHAERLDERHHTRHLDSRVELTLSLSYQHLPADRRRLFRLTALHPGHDFDSYAAAALAGTDLPAARDHLHQLCLDHLLQQPTPGRYVFHDLVRAYAADRAADEERPPERRAALTGLLDHYLHTAATAMDTLYPAEQHRRPRIPGPATPTPAVADPAAARAWLELERANLISAAIYAADTGLPDHTIRLAATVHRHLDIGGHFDQAITLNTRARDAAGHTGDHAAEAHALMRLGSVDIRQGRYRRAADHEHQAITLFRDVGDRDGEARALANLGIIYQRLGRNPQAADLETQALTIYQEIGDPEGEANATDCLGTVYAALGRRQEAAAHHQRSLAIYREIGDRQGEAIALGNVGLAYHRMGHYQQALAHHEQALELCRALGERGAEAHVLDNLGNATMRLGHHGDAVSHFRQAIDIFRQLGDRGGEAVALNGLGEALLAAGQPDQARAEHAAALAFASETGRRAEQARAHNGLAHTYRATGDPDQAHHHWRQALAIYVELNVPEADQVRAQLLTQAGVQQSQINGPNPRSNRLDSSGE